MNTAEIRELAERVWSEPWISRRSRLVTWSILNGLADRIDRGASDAAFPQVSGRIDATPTSQVVEHLSRGLTPGKEGL